MATLQATHARVGSAQVHFSESDDRGAQDFAARTGLRAMQRYYFNIPVHPNEFAALQGKQDFRSAG